MALPSLGDVVFIIVVLIPGFLTLTLFRWLAILENKISDYVLTVYSLSFSLLILTIYAFHTNITDIDVIRTNILSPTYLVEILAIALSLGVGFGLIVRYAFRRRIVRGSPWEASMTVASKEGCWVIVYTEDGREYKGTLHRSGGGDYPSEISIRDPKQILRDDQFKIKREIPVGLEILFREKDIRRVVFFEEI